ARGVLSSRFFGRSARPLVSAPSAIDGPESVDARRWRVPSDRSLVSRSLAGRAGPAGTSWGPAQPDSGVGIVHGQPSRVVLFVPTGRAAGWPNGRAHQKELDPVSAKLAFEFPRLAVRFERFARPAERVARDLGETPSGRRAVHTSAHLRDPVASS